jgi:hypothetical protein
MLVWKHIFCIAIYWLVLKVGAEWLMFDVSLVEAMDVGFSLPLPDTLCSFRRRTVILNTFPYFSFYLYFSLIIILIYIFLPLHVSLTIYLISFYVFQCCIFFSFPFHSFPFNPSYSIISFLFMFFFPLCLFLHAILLFFLSSVLFFLQLSFLYFIRPYVKVP